MTAYRGWSEAFMMSREVFRGSVIAMKEPFEFSIDPADLLDAVDAAGADASE